MKPAPTIPQLEPELSRPVLAPILVPALAPGLAPGASGSVSSEPEAAGQAAPKSRPRLIFAIDATASRAAAYEAAKSLTDVLFSAIPGGLDVALAVHGGNRLHTFTDFSSDFSMFRSRAAAISCIAGETRFVEILEKAKLRKAAVLIYIGDAFEENVSRARAAANALAGRTRVIILQDGDDHGAGAVFGEIAGITGGAVLPFDHAATAYLRDLLSAIAILAICGEEGLSTASSDAAAALRAGLRK